MSIKTKKILSAVLASVLIASSMAACSNNSGEPSKTSEKSGSPFTEKTSAKIADGLTGKFTMTSYIKDGDPVDLSDNNAKGIFSTIEIKEDGTGEFDLFGIKSDVTVEGENITLAGSKSTYSISGDVLTVVNGASTMVFKRGEGTVTPASDSKPAEDSSKPDEASTVPAESGTPQASDTATDEKVTVKKGDWENIEWETYTDPNGYFTLEKPKGWNVNTNDLFKGTSPSGLMIGVSHPDREMTGATVLDFVNLPTYKLKEQTVESLFKDQLYNNPIITEWNVVNSQTTDEQKKMMAQSSFTVLDAKVLRIEFTQSGLSAEGMYSAFLCQSSVSGYYTSLLVNTAYSPRGEFENWAGIFAKIQSSVKYTDAYHARYKTSGNSSASGSVSDTSGFSGYDAGDDMMNSWNARNKSEDIMNQKRQDATLGYERVYDTQTGDIYRADSGFMEKYDLNDGQRYAAATDDMYTEGYSGYISMD